MEVKDRILNFIKSFKFHILLTILLFSIVPSLALIFGMIHSYESRAVSVRSIEIMNQARILGNQILTNRFIEDDSSETIKAEMNQLSNIYDGRVMLINSSLKIVQDTYGLDKGKTIISEEVIRCLAGNEISTYDSDIGYIELAIPIINTESQEADGVLLVSVSTDLIKSTRDYLYNGGILTFASIFLFMLVLSTLAATRITRPLRMLTTQISDIEVGYRDTLDVNNFTETAEISNQFNHLYNRMKVVDSSREEFVSNVSHELKTPLTSMKVLADSLNGSDEVPIELYREFMVDIGNEIDRETKIINDLLSLVKMDKSQATLNIETVNINELVELILKRLRPIAQRQQIEIVLESFRPVTAEVDEVKLTLAITNLVENAIKYNKPEGWIHVTLNSDHQFFYIKVEDSGLGIPEDSIEHIFERFYRVDKSHSREIGGTGLGLAITRSAVHMHRGAIKVFSVEGEGTVFDVRIPLTYIPPEK